MDNQQATDFEIGWLAGIVDGEGWLGISAYEDKRRPVNEGPYGHRLCVKTELKITNCDEPIIDKATEILQKIGVNPYRRTQHNSPQTRRLVHECAIKHMASLQKVLPVLLDHLTGNKQERARIILRFIELRKTNGGFPNPEYSTSIIRPGKPGRHGPGRIKPYTDEEMMLIESCRALQSRGASEAIRENRERAIRAVKAVHARVQQK